MQQTTLKWLRLIAPGVIIIIFTYIFGLITDLFRINAPTNINELNNSLFVIVFAGLYYVSGVRRFFNKKFSSEVTENLRQKLVAAAGFEDDPERFTWKKIRSVFYHLIDNDKSLEKKSYNAYFNGFIWTTLADIRAISVIFGIISLPIAWFITKEAVITAFLFFIIAIMSYIGSRTVTKWHREIGDEQIEIIQNYHQQELRDKLESIRNE